MCHKNERLSSIICKLVLEVLGRCIVGRARVFITDQHGVTHALVNILADQVVQLLADRLGGFLQLAEPKHLALGVGINTYKLEC